MNLKPVTLGDKYDLSCGQVFVSGTQAVVRMLMMQHERDRRAGLNTAGFVSGYRGSPIGGLDQQLWSAGDALAEFRDPFPAGTERGTGRDRVLGHAAGRTRRTWPP